MFKRLSAVVLNDLGVTTRYILTLISIILTFVGYGAWKSLSHVLLHQHDIFATAVVVVLVLSVIFFLVYIGQELILFDGHGVIKGKCSRGHEDADDVAFETWNSASKATYDKENGYYHDVLSPQLPTFVILHGNGEAACCWVDGYVNIFHKNFHCNIAIFEYRGYGRRHAEAVGCSLLSELRDDIDKQWTHLSTMCSGPMLLVGISLGGGFAWSTIDRLRPAPSQLILIDTFSDFNLLFRSFGGNIFSTLLRPFMSHNILRFDIKVQHKKWRGSVLCVHTIDDVLFPPEHMRTLRQHFKEDCGCVWDEFECAHGGHLGGPYTFQGWLKLVQVPTD